VSIIVNEFPLGVKAVVKQVINVKKRNNIMLKLFGKRKLVKKNELKNIVIVHENDEKYRLVMINTMWV
jgi:hypothetical protein